MTEMVTFSPSFNQSQACNMSTELWLVEKVDKQPFNLKPNKWFWVRAEIFRVGICFVFLGSDNQLPGQPLEFFSDLLYET